MDELRSVRRRGDLDLIGAWCGDVSKSEALFVPAHGERPHILEVYSPQIVPGGLPSLSLTTPASALGPAISSLSIEGQRGNITIP